MASRYVIAKYMGDDIGSWAVFLRADIQGIPRPIVDYSVKPIVTGCYRAEAESHKQDLEKRYKRKNKMLTICEIDTEMAIRIKLLLDRTWQTVGHDLNQAAIACHKRNITDEEIVDGIVDGGELPEAYGEDADALKIFRSMSLEDQQQFVRDQNFSI